MKLMTIGCGVLASKVIELLSWIKGDFEIVVGARDTQQAQRILNLVEFVSENLNKKNILRLVRLDLNDIEFTAETIFKEAPDIIFNTATMQSYWVISELPKPIYNALTLAGVGPWLPLHLTPVMKLMKAVKECGLANVITVNSAFPDAVNPCLKLLGLEPNIGIGNVSNVVQPIRKAISLELKKPIDEIQVRLICHHSVSNSIPTYGSTKGAPYILDVESKSENITSLLEENKIFSLVMHELSRPRGKDGMWVTASSAVSVINALISKDTVKVHAPGPNGLIGGYPLLVSKNSIELDLPSNITIEEAEQVNKEGQILDGIDSIEQDSKVINFNPKSVDLFKSILGYDCPRMSIADTEEFANELLGKYKEFKNQWVVS